MAIRTDISDRNNKDFSNALLVNDLKSDVIQESSLIISNGESNAETRKAIKALDKLISDGVGTSLIVNGIDSSFNTHEYAERIRRANKESVRFVENSMPIHSNHKRFRVIGTPICLILDQVGIKKAVRDAIVNPLSNIITQITIDTNNCESIVYNRVTLLLEWINEFYPDKKSLKDTIVMYGKPNKNEILFFKLLANAGLNFIILNPTAIKIEIDNIKSITLREYDEIKDLNKLQYSTVETAAYKAEKAIDKELFEGDNLGLYKPGKINKCIPRKFACAYDEIQVWWNKDMYIRPGFKQVANTVELPIIFALIKGVPDDLKNGDFIKTINRFTYADTLIYTNGEFTNDRITDYFKIPNEQLLEEIKDIKNNSSIEDIVNKKYKIYDQQLRNRLIDASNAILNDKELITKMNEDQKQIRLGLEILLVSLESNIIDMIQGFDFVGKNPNIVVVSYDDRIVDQTSSLWLALMHNLGFDILVFVPNGYSSIDEYIPDKYYTQYNLGKPRRDFTKSDINTIKLFNNEQEAIKASKLKKRFFNFFKK